MKQIVNDIIQLSEIDKNLCTDRDKVSETFGHNPKYLLDHYGITKSDLIRLERLGLALKARYEVRHPKAELYAKLNENLPKVLAPLTCKNGTHRVRWILFKPEASNG